MLEIWKKKKKLKSMIKECPKNGMESFLLNHCSKF